MKTLLVGRTDAMRDTALQALSRARYQVTVVDDPHELQRGIAERACDLLVACWGPSHDDLWGPLRALGPRGEIPLVAVVNESADLEALGRIDIDDVLQVDAPEALVDLRIAIVGRRVIERHRSHFSTQGSTAVGVVSHLLSSAPTLPSAYADIVQFLRMHFGVTGVLLALSDEVSGELSMEASAGISQEGSLPRRVPFENSVLGRVVQTKRSLVERALDGFHADLWSPTPIETLLAVPLFAGERVLGVLALVHASVVRSESTLLDTLQVVGNQLADETQRRRVNFNLRTLADMQRLVAELGQRALAGMPLEDLMDDCASVVAGALEVEFVQIVEVQADAYVVRSACGFPESIVGLAEIAPEGRGPSRFTVGSDEPVVIADAQTDWRFSMPQHLRGCAIASGLSVKLDGNGVRGAMSAFSRHARTFSADDIQFMRAVANLLGAHMDRSRAHEQSRLLHAAIEQADEAFAIAEARWADGAPLLFVNKAFVSMTEAGSFAEGTLRDIPSLAGVWERIVADLEPLGRGRIVGGRATLSRAVLPPLDIEWQATPLRDRSDMVTHVVLAQRDITERKRYEEMLRDSERRLRDIIESAPIPIFITRPDSGAIVFGNAQCAELLGLASTRELDDRPSLAFFADAPGRESLLQLLERKKRVVAQEFHLRRADGTRIWCLGSAVPMVLDGEDVIVGSLMDITDRRRAEQALRESEATLRSFYESTPIMMGILELVDDDIFHVSCNTAAATLLRSTPDAVQGKFGSQLSVERKEVLFWRSKLEQARDRDAPLHFEFTMPQGTRRVCMSATICRIDTGDARRPQFSYMVEDITERRNVQNQLVLADRLASIGTLAAGVAHEINNPLAYVLANVSFAAEEANLVAERLSARRAGGSSRRADADSLARLKELSTALAEAREGADRVRQIVRDLKTFSRGDEESSGPVDVRAVLELSINMAMNQIRPRARLVREYGEVPFAVGNESRLGQVFLNLIINAAQAIAEGAADRNEIRLVTKTDKLGRVVVEVHDTGAGIPSDTLPRIFEPFYTTKSVGEGTGLGLAICHGIVTALGGEIDVSSQPGKGSVFRVVLPATPATPRSIPSVQSQGPSQRRGRVLIIDDDPRVGSALSRMLSSEHEVEVVSQARDALARIVDGQTYDVILCDVLMPGMSGMEFYETLAKVAFNQTRKVVFLTGGAFTPLARQFLATVDNAQIDKPIDPVRLRDCLADLMR